MRSFRTLAADLVSAPALAIAGLAATAALAAQGGRASLLLDVIGQFALVLFAAGLASSPRPWSRISGRADGWSRSAW
jgi:hypothetical protein